MLELQNGYIVCFNFVLVLFVIFGVIDYCIFKVLVFVFMESLILGLFDCLGVSVIIVLFFYISIEMFQGMRVRFFNFFFLLKLEIVVWRIVEVVQFNQVFFFFLWMMYVFVILKSIFLQVVFEEIYKFLGIYICMNIFKGWI